MAQISIQDLLDRMEYPAFCAEDGIIRYANQAALSRSVVVGDPVLPILGPEQEAYRDFTGGCLSMTLALNGVRFDASVTKLGGMDLFTLEPGFESGELQALALAARELREPLNSLMAATESLFSRHAEERDAHDAREMALINQNLYRFLRLVGNMSDAGSLARADLEFRDATAVAQEIFDNARDLCEAAGVTLEFTNLPVSAYTMLDSDRLERAIYNLLSNALKFTPAGGTIRSQLVRRRNNLHLILEDPGAQLDFSMAGGLFRRYLREPGLEDSRQGIGLGMSLVRSIALAHGGTVLAENRPEGGVRVTLSLPIRQEHTCPLRSPVLRIDYAGERNHALVELSENLPPELYAPDKL